MKCQILFDSKIGDRIHNDFGWIFLSSMLNVEPIALQCVCGFIGNEDLLLSKQSFRQREKKNITVMHKSQYY